jgi:hypothetical protein
MGRFRIVMGRFRIVMGKFHITMGKLPIVMSEVMATVASLRRAVQGNVALMRADDQFYVAETLSQSGDCPHAMHKTRPHAV